MHMRISSGGCTTIADAVIRHTWSAANARGSQAPARSPDQCRGGESVLTHTATYAIRAMVCLAEARGETCVTAAQVARRTGLPRTYLAKILRVLAHVGLLDSTRGPHGGD